MRVSILGKMEQEIELKGKVVFPEEEEFRLSVPEGMSLTGKEVSWEEKAEDGRILECAVALNAPGESPRFTWTKHRLGEADIWEDDFWGDDFGGFDDFDEDAEDAEEDGIEEDEEEDGWDVSGEDEAEDGLELSEDDESSEEEKGA